MVNLYIFMNKYCKNIFYIFKNKKTGIFIIYSYFKYFIWIKTKPIFIKKISFDSNKTFIRWWDGETLTLLWISFLYEDSSSEFSNKFLKILNYKWDKFILWLPLLYLENNEENTPFLRAWLITRNYFNKVNLWNKGYWDAFFFINLWNISKFINIYKNKKIFLVSNIKTINKVRTINDLSCIWFQEIPEKKSYKLYNEIKNGILDKVNKLETDNLVIIISWWPVAKILAYELTIEYNYICHDVWSYFDRNLTS